MYKQVDELKIGEPTVNIGYGSEETVIYVTYSFKFKGNYYDGSSTIEPKELERQVIEFMNNSIKPL